MGPCVVAPSLDSLQLLLCGVRIRSQNENGGLLLRRVNKKNPEVYLRVRAKLSKLQQVTGRRIPPKNCPTPTQPHVGPEPKAEGDVGYL